MLNVTKCSVWLCGKIAYFHEVVLSLLFKKREGSCITLQQRKLIKSVTLNYVLVFACLGFLSPANRGALMTCAVVLWVLLGTPAGYVAARFYKCK